MTWAEKLKAWSTQDRDERYALDRASHPSYDTRYCTLCGVSVPQSKELWTIHDAFHLGDDDEFLEAALEGVLDVRESLR